MSRRVLITGGGAGIGAGLARRFANEGDRIAICDADAGAVAQMQSEFPDAICVQADVTSEADMNAFLDRVETQWGGIDVVCANAGTGGPAGRIEDLDYKEWQSCLSVNLDGCFLTCRWASRLMRAQKAGLIVITSSTAGLFGYPLRSPYATAKWGLIGLTKTLASELGPDGVRVNAICPGAVEGDRMERVLAMEAASSDKSIDELRETYVKGTSMRTWVTIDDLTDMVIFLASSAAGKVSGQIIAVDGHTETIV
jgi:NAD(P)-dependent dehydrogenase (short-subunit alcohol dehydrogenase family)